MRIMVIDDDPVILEFMKEFVELMDYPVEIFSDSRLALAACRENQYELVITDYLMPDMDGKAVASELHRLHPEMPIVIVSSEEGYLKKENFLENNVVALLKKPLNLRELQKVITLINEKKEEM